LPAAAKTPAASKAKRSRFKFISEIIAELKKVVWPPRDQVIYLTVVVIIVTIILGAVLGSLDWGFSHLMHDVILK
jgi:preprotein translocase subunit SecE